MSHFRSVGEKPREKKDDKNKQDEERPPVSIYLKNIYKLNTNFL